MDEQTAAKLDRVEVLLLKAKGAEGRDPREAERLLSEAQTLAQDALSGSAQITLPGTLAALRSYRPQPRGYWRAG